jgi:hypothetical protein
MKRVLHYITVIRFGSQVRKPSRETGCKRSRFKSPTEEQVYFYPLISVLVKICPGTTANYLLSVNEDALGNIPDFGQRDLKARFNANLGNVLKLEPNMDVYPT